MMRPPEPCGVLYALHLASQPAIYDDLLLRAAAEQSAGGFAEIYDEAENLWWGGDWTALGVLHLRAGDCAVKLGIVSAARLPYLRAAAIFGRRTGFGCRQDEAAAVYACALLDLRDGERLRAGVRLRQAAALLNEEYRALKWSPGEKARAARAKRLADYMTGKADQLRPRLRGYSGGSEIGG